ncbi:MULTISPECIES: VOC family protein [unclassified Sphingopyxis]|uniref:VOC family protein n=1 Tax=unclassified Sphingopyxis TaxID=2614943 RepID=UPI000730261F|nr:MULTISPECIES: VOC family protein [unclassified Sphingopyxis]KTE21577.1 glyoxalase [Sphingopyxis sp. H057]KTE49574.1 glyoxalase [Sphingopyxis sp. H073]KTE49768.1 glyoxalase [Sphingopyxis sp. H071]KTE58200.1 glyoxalase [Sphingopyxis sp. H107]KTE62651.1 glyoxalase [Sphingopyxis sp. H100]
MTTACTQGAHHIGLAVRDVAEARDFFVEALGFGVAAERPDYPAIFVTDGTTLLTLWQVADPAGATAFDRRANIGLHHLALRVADLDALRTVFARVQNHPGTVIEFDPEPIREGATTHHFICAMPGGIRIEFATPFA